MATKARKVKASPREPVAESELVRRARELEAVLAVNDTTFDAVQAARQRLDEATVRAMSRYF
jgi:hypothetical protein